MNCRFALKEVGTNKKQSIYMKKILTICLILLGTMAVFSCKEKTNKDESDPNAISNRISNSDYGLDVVADYYKEYTKKLSNANDSVAIDCITKAAVEDYQKMVAKNADKLVALLTSSAKGNISPDNPELKAVESAWKECNLMLSEKTHGRYEYMPDFNDMYGLLYDKLPNELKEPVKPADIPTNVFGDQDECGDDCDHDHGNPFLNPSF